MPIFGLTEELIFPPTYMADESGILAVGGDFRPERLYLAYQNGIFPWPHEGYPLLWFCPSERFVLHPKQVHLPRSLQKILRKNTFEIKFDTCFLDVIKGCQKAARPDQDGTWITDEMIDGYHALHLSGVAHSVEAFFNGELAGGFYGVSLGGIFFGESMFSTMADASKVAFATLVGHLIRWNFDLIDCQSPTEHLARFGADLIPRDEFLHIIATSQKRSSKLGKWICTMTPLEALQEIRRACDVLET